jgi:hypothetical protein
VSQAELIEAVGLPLHHLDESHSTESRGINVLVFCLMRYINKKKLFNQSRKYHVLPPFPPLYIIIIIIIIIHFNNYNIVNPFFLISCYLIPLFVICVFSYVPALSL